MQCFKTKIDAEVTGRVFLSPLIINHKTINISFIPQTGGENETTKQTFMWILCQRMFSSSLILAHLFILNRISLDMKCEFLHVYLFFFAGRKTPKFVNLKTMSLIYNGNNLGVISIKPHTLVLKFWKTRTLQNYQYFSEGVHYRPGPAWAIVKDHCFSVWLCSQWNYAV